MTDEELRTRLRVTAPVAVVAAGAAVAGAIWLAFSVASDGRFGRGSAGPEGAPIRVEVLNGAGRAGIAGEATDLLRGAGFDVVFFGNADRFDHASSAVLDRVDDPDAAWAVARALGIDDVRDAPDQGLFVHATVILGQDWAAPAPGEPAGPRDRLVSFWRRLFGTAIAEDRGEPPAP